MVALNYEALPADWPPIRALSVSIAARTAASETRRLKQQRDATPRRQSVRRNTIMIPRDGRLVGEKPTSGQGAIHERDYDGRLMMLFRSVIITTIPSPVG